MIYRSSYYYKKKKEKKKDFFLCLALWYLIKFALAV